MTLPATNLGDLAPLRRTYALPGDVKPIADMVSAVFRSAQDLPTPVLLLDRDHLIAQVNRWRRHLPHVTMHYAVKANNDPLVFDALAQLDISFDVASDFEVQLAVAAGIPGSRMILSNPRKDDATIRSILEHRPWGFTIDREIELTRLRNFGLPSAGYDPTLFVRVRVKSRNVKDDLNVKFGCRPDMAVDLLAKAKTAGFTKFGIAFHVGTQCYESENYRSACGACVGLADEAQARGITVSVIDIGGGFCDARLASEHGTSHDSLLAEVGGITKGLAKRFQIIAEPGRYVVADVGTICVQVLSEYWSETTQRNVSVNDHIYGAFSGTWCDGRRFDLYPLRIDAKESPLLATTTTCTVFGGTCDSIDRVGDNYLLPINLKPGDFLIAPCAGAYSNSAGSNFNGLDPAGLVLCWREGDRVKWQLSPITRKNEILLAAIRAYFKSVAVSKGKRGNHEPRMSSPP